jgi:hypothetical protein
MLARICMTLKPEEVVCAVSSDAKIKVNYTKMAENLGLKYSKKHAV